MTKFTTDLLKAILILFSIYNKILQKCFMAFKLGPFAGKTRRQLISREILKAV